MKFALEKPAFRILVNTVASIGAVGYTTSLTPSMTLGPGTWGGSIISDNVSAKHLMNIKSLAFETNPINKGECVTSFSTPELNYTPTTQSSFMKEIEERLKARAGNRPLKDSYLPVRQTGVPYKEQQQKKKDEKKEVYGSGITKEDVDQIINEFKF
jgi:acetaldehyde dehydrogenase (acetylating)